MTVIERTTAKVILAFELIAAATTLAETGVMAQEATARDLGVLKTQFDQAIRSSDQPGALSFAMQMIATTQPQHVEALYAATQIQARIGNGELAYLYLSRAIGAGFADRGRLRGDETFRDYRDDDLFNTLARRAWARGYYDLLERPNREDVQMSPGIMKIINCRPKPMSERP